MTDKITKEFLFTELSIKIATLDMKLDKVLELLNLPEVEVISLGNKIPSDEQFTEDYK